MARYRGLSHLLVGVLAGVLGGLAAAAVGSRSVAWLLAWSAGTLGYAAATWTSVWRLDGEQTRRHATSEDVGRPVVDVAVLTGALVSVTVIGLVIVGGADASLPLTVVVGVVAIVSSWLAVHTMFWVRYVRRYYAAGAGMSFHDTGGGPPSYSDFAYVAFTVAMTFQVSDTEITTNAMRRAVLGHALTSFVFVAVILAVLVNLVGSLAS